MLRGLLIPHRQLSGSGFFSKSVLAHIHCQSAIIFRSNLFPFITEMFSIISNSLMVCNNPYQHETENIYDIIIEVNDSR